jgi:hypothetical protein
MLRALTPNSISEIREAVNERSFDLIGFFGSTKTMPHHINTSLVSVPANFSDACDLCALNPVPPPIRVGSLVRIDAVGKQSLASPFADVEGLTLASAGID